MVAENLQAEGFNDFEAELPHTVALEIEQFDLGRIEQVSPVEHSYSSDNYRVETSRGSFFVKSREFASPEQAAEIIEAEIFFSEAGLPVFPAVPARGGKRFVKTDGHSLSVYPFLDGDIVERDSLTSDHLGTLGDALAQMHEKSRHSSLPIRRRAPIDRHTAVESIEDLLDQLPVNLTREDLQVLELLNLKQRVVQRTTKIPDLSYDHLIHGDFQNKNVLFESPTSVAAIVDFDNSEVAPRSLEVARTLDKVCFNGKFDEARFECARILLGAYTDRYNIAAVELTEGINLYYAYKATNLWREYQIYSSGNEKPRQFISIDLAVLEYMEHHQDDYARRLADFLD